MPENKTENTNISENAVEQTAELPETSAQSENKSFDVAAQKPILKVDGLKKYFAIQTNFFGKPTRHLKAVDDVSFEVAKGKTIGVVGESGCGKTTLGRTILKLYESDGGKIYFDGNDITALSKKQMMKYRTDLQLIFQDPYSSLPPRMTVGQIISEAVVVHKIVPKDQVYAYVQDIMKKCGLQPQYYDRYPHEFSGGQRQRICIARALAVKPKVVICDEPVSALDVSIQAQIINLLKELQNSMGLTYVFISHDLSVVKYITDSILVMYLGNAMEQGKTDDIFGEPLHPYTKALFSAVPAPDPTVKMNRIILEGDIPSPANPPEGCKFHTRCSQCMDVCKFVQPKTIEARRDHFVACHLYDEEVMARLDELSAEYARREEEKRVRLEEERIKKENAKLYKFKKKLVGLKNKFVGLFTKKKDDGTGGETGRADESVERPAPDDLGTSAASEPVAVGAVETSAELPAEQPVETSAEQSVERNVDSADDTVGATVDSANGDGNGDDAIAERPADGGDAEPTNAKKPAAGKSGTAGKSSTRPRTAAGKSGTAGKSSTSKPRTAAGKSGTASKSSAAKPRTSAGKSGTASKSSAAKPRTSAGKSSGAAKSDADGGKA